MFKKAKKGEKVTKEDVLKWNVIPSKVVKPVVETDISRAANSFAKDSTNIKYRFLDTKSINNKYRKRLRREMLTFRRYL